MENLFFSYILYYEYIYFFSSKKQPFPLFGVGCFLEERTISSVGQSVRLISERSLVQVQYGPPPFPLFPIFLVCQGFAQAVKKRFLIESSTEGRFLKGIQLSWQSTAFARQGPRVRIPLFPPFFLDLLFLLEEIQKRSDLFFLCFFRSKKRRLTVETQALRDDEGRRGRRYASGSWEQAQIRRFPNRATSQRTPF